MKRAQKDKRQGKVASTQAGEFVREEIDHVREGKHGARSAKQAIAIGLSKARRAGVKLPPPKNGSKATKKKAAQDSAKGRKAPATKHVSSKRSRATLKALKREGHSAGSKKALARQTKRAASKRTAADRSRAAKKAAKTRAHEKG
ncbi:MAG TPA: DUF6496 domain-containing protein [Polyangiaceae bacterium]